MFLSLNLRRKKILAYLITQIKKLKQYGHGKGLVKVYQSGRNILISEARKNLKETCVSNICRIINITKCLEVDSLDGSCENIYIPIVGKNLRF